MKKSALIVGSVVFDVIFAIHGDIKNELHIKDGKLEPVNMMFTAKDKQQYYGGTAGNIAYGLGALGATPILHSVVGEDFNINYKDHLEYNNVQLRLKVVKDKFTSTFYGISDEKYQQIGIFQPNVYYDFLNEFQLSDSLSGKDIEEVSFAIFSPGTGDSTKNLMLELRKLKQDNVQIIFDPSQVLSILFQPDVLRECLSMSDIFIGNETEVKQLKTIFNYELKDLFDLGIKYIIETKGSEGSVVYTKDETKQISAHKPKKIVETTGAGDAFRAGLLYGLLNNYSIYDSCKIGSYMGAKNVEEYGGQLYKPSLEEIKNLFN